jgi:hypothetical protein
MRSYVTLSAFARFYTPLIVLFAGALLVVNGPGQGIGVIAGFVFALALAVHILVFGSDAALSGASPASMRALISLGLIIAFIGVGAPGLAMAAQLAEAGAFISTAAGAALILTVLVGRAPTMRDEQ